MNECLKNSASEKALEEARKGMVDDPAALAQIRAFLMGAADGKGGDEENAIYMPAIPIRLEIPHPATGFLVDNIFLARLKSTPPEFRTRILKDRMAAIVSEIQDMAFEMEAKYPRTKDEALSLIPTLELLGNGIRWSRQTGLPLVVSGFPTYGDCGERQGEIQFRPGSVKTLDERLSDNGKIMTPVTIYILEVLDGARIVSMETSIAGHMQVRFSPMYDDVKKTGQTLLDRLENILPPARMLGDNLAAIFHGHLKTEAKVEMMQYGDDMAYWMKKGGSRICIIMDRMAFRFRAGIDRGDAPLHTPEKAVWDLGIEEIAARIPVIYEILLDRINPNRINDEIAAICAKIKRELG